MSAHINRTVDRLLCWSVCVWAVWSGGLLSGGELRSNECWLGNRMLWWAFCQAHQFYCTIWNLSRSQRLSQQSGKSIPAPWLYCARRITANRLSVHALTSAEVCVEWHRVRVKIFKHYTGEASQREQGMVYGVLRQAITEYMHYTWWGSRDKRVNSYWILLLNRNTFLGRWTEWHLNTRVTPLSATSYSFILVMFKHGHRHH